MKDFHPHDWHFSAGSEDLATVEHAEKVFLERTLQIKDKDYETQITRRNGLWIFEYRETK